MLPSGILRKLSDEEMAIYRAPYRDRESRLPTLVWPREIPIDGEPADVVAIVERYGEWLYQSTLPKLFFIGETGRILVAGRGREFARSWPNQQVVTVKGVHYLQEASPVEPGDRTRDVREKCSCLSAFVDLPAAVLSLMEARPSCGPN
jgi:haloalkane dehalogenase